MNKIGLVIALIPLALIALIWLGFDVLGVVFGFIAFLYRKIVVEQAWLWFGLCILFFLINRLSPRRDRRVVNKLF